MRTLLALLLLSLPAQAAVVVVPRPYHTSAILPWIKVPYPDCPLKHTIRGVEYTVTNPTGVGCHPQYKSTDWFECWLKVDDTLRTIEIEAGCFKKYPLW